MRGEYNVLSKIVTRDVSQSEKKQYLKLYNNVHDFVFFLLIYFSIQSVGKKWKQLQNAVSLFMFKCKYYIFERQGIITKIQQLKIDMTVVTKETNKYKRSLISSPDNRVSSKIIGWTGISAIICVLLVIVLLDIGHLLRFISRFQTVFRN
jgi:hypothetical protein